MRMIPISPARRCMQIHRDLSHETLRSHARGRSLHAPPLTLAQLYDLCGEVNEDVRNVRLRTDFCVVWLGEVPEGSTAYASSLTHQDAEHARVLVCVHCDGAQASTVLWYDGHLAATCSDEALRATHELLRVHDMRMGSFQTLNTAFARLKEWGPTRQAAVVCTAAKAACGGLDPIEAVEELPPSDAFVVQHDGLAKGSDLAFADVLTHVLAPAMAPEPMFNSNVRLFF